MTLPGCSSYWKNLILPRDTRDTKNPKIPNYIISSNKDCLNAMAKKAKSLGLKYLPLFDGPLLSASFTF